MRKKNLHILLTLALCAVMAFGLSAVAEQPADISLADWEGTWNSFVGYSDDKELEQPLKELAEKKNTTLEALKAGAQAMMHSDIAGMTVADNEISFFDNFESRGGKLIDKATYAYEKTHQVKFGNFDVDWYEFRAQGDAKYPVLILCDVHGEESMTHFHLRYGDDVNKLLADENWWPTYVKPTSTYEQIVSGFSHGDGGDEHDHDHDHGKEDATSVQMDVSLADWAGAWNNMGAYLDDEQLKGAFETLAKNEGTSVEEAKEKYVKKRKCDFNGMVVKDNTIQFLDNFEDKNGKIVSESEYTYVETYKVKHGQHDMEWHVFRAADKDAAYPELLLMDVHGEELLTHFHLRYGTSAKDMLAKDGWYPTFVKPTSTYDQLIAEITE